MTKLESVAKLNPIKLKISLECNSILNIIQRKKESNSKITKTERKSLGWGDFFRGNFSLRDNFLGRFFLGGIVPPGDFLRRGKVS